MKTIIKNHEFNELNEFLFSLISLIKKMLAFFIREICINKLEKIRLIREIRGLKLISGLKSY